MCGAVRALHRTAVRRSGAGARSSPRPALHRFPIAGGAGFSAAVPGVSGAACSGGCPAGAGSGPAGRTRPGAPARAQGLHDQRGGARAELDHPLRGLGAHELRHVLREPPQHGQTSLRGFARGALRRAEDLPYVLGGPVELQGLQAPLHGLRRRHVPHPARGQAEEPVAGQAGRSQEQREVAVRGRPGHRAGQFQQWHRRARDRARGGSGPQDPGAPALPRPVGQVPLGGAQRVGLDPPVELVEPLGGLAPVPEGERPAGEVAVLSGIPGWPLGLHLRLTHPALPLPALTCGGARVRNDAHALPTFEWGAMGNDSPDFRSQGGLHQVRARLVSHSKELVLTA